jgi:hypothetical protein
MTLIIQYFNRGAVPSLLGTIEFKKINRGAVPSLLGTIEFKKINRGAVPSILGIIKSSQTFNRGAVPSLPGNKRKSGLLIPLKRPLIIPLIMVC